MFCTPVMVRFTAEVQISSPVSLYVQHSTPLLLCCGAASTCSVDDSIPVPALAGILYASASESIMRVWLILHWMLQTLVATAVHWNLLISPGVVTTEVGYWMKPGRQLTKHPDQPKSAIYQYTMQLSEYLAVACELKA